MKKAVFILALLFAFAGFSVSPIFAEVLVANNVNIHTTVLNPQTADYVDSLGLSDPMYNPGDTVTFHVTIANNGTDTVNSLTIDNSLPDYVTFTAGAGNLSQSKKILTFIVKNLDPKTTQSFAISGKINDDANLPTNQGVVCVADKAVIENEPNQPLSSASFCIQKGSTQTTQTTKGGLPLSQNSSTVYPANTNLTTTPPTGPEALSFVSVLISGLGGFILRKFSKKK